MDVSCAAFECMEGFTVVCLRFITYASGETIVRT